MKHSLLFLACFAVLGNLFSQISITSSSFTTNQNFDGLGNSGSPTWTDNSTIANWYSNKTAYTAGTGSSNSGSMYSFGAVSTSERALGSLGSAGNATCHFGVRLKNNTTSLLSSISITYVGEQWRRGDGTADKIVFAYAVSASPITTITTGSYTANSNLDFIPPQQTTPNNVLLDGNLAANRTSISFTLPVSVPAGSEIMLRWTDTNSTGNDDGVSIDDFQITAVVLPIELTDFSAKKESTGVNALNWQTATETNTRQFDIQRSPDAQNWESIGQVAAAGDSRDTKNYTFTDEKPLPVSFYRLRSVDFDGAEQFSPIERVAQNGAGKTASIQPTAVENEATLFLGSDLETEATARVFDLMGRQVFAQDIFVEKGENRIPLSLGSLPSGQYLIKTDGNGAPATRFVKI